MIYSLRIKSSGNDMTFHLVNFVSNDHRCHYVDGVLTSYIEGTYFFFFFVKIHNVKPVPKGKEKSVFLLSGLVKIRNNLRADCRFPSSFK